ncbi:hypothetical protein NDU88_005589 [Pleurodeles waltl]|uniref:Uncharacterized protein n=1 Tax=Pleurodeles waltl TaxID=8319 RepID=A0AAV7QFQ4_PLEWA|nr:hypothetical protein NDU88_005589 [Pleurodeles waltl]
MCRPSNEQGMWGRGRVVTHPLAPRQDCGQKPRPPAVTTCPSPQLCGAPLQSPALWAPRISVGEEPESPTWVRPAEAAAGPQWALGGHKADNEHFLQHRGPDVRVAGAKQGATALVSESLDSPHQAQTGNAARGRSSG